MLRHEFQPGRLVAGFFLTAAGLVYAGDAGGLWDTPWFAMIPIVVGGLFLAAATAAVAHGIRKARRPRAKGSGRPAGAPGRPATGPSSPAAWPSPDSAKPSAATGTPAGPEAKAPATGFGAAPDTASGTGTASDTGTTSGTGTTPGRTPDRGADKAADRP
ncbi:hypothetical protein [Streptomyces flavofungini]|uniref:hypothetical protein n=1 Tax=Streptomyces flavofungini TaxID=68200 RepID=UPI0025B103C8|nr:hypothetical protein [Streptomyces flavofungini]WJV51632.1 hypothetical protein QUY26_15020 [Streptomyces flavofungini]